MNAAFLSGSGLISLEVEFGRQLQQPTTEFVGCESEAGRWGVDRGGWGCAGHGEIHLGGTSRAEAVERVIEEVESGDAELQIPLAPNAEAFLGAQVGVKERWTVRVGKDVLPVLADFGQSEAGAVNVLVRAA